MLPALGGPTEPGSDISLALTRCRPYPSPRHKLLAGPCALSQGYRHGPFCAALGVRPARGLRGPWACSCGVCPVSAAGGLAAAVCVLVGVRRTRQRLLRCC